ncbi:hypothetical protein HORIV_28640 [Vreelandella olivaria]|uniref:Type II toxin-antitoxin system RelE/ParE family toxin n=1 Tax=Vreelandella olivaria TaxID=390919 RepID=A0ABM7GID5_9GAMM|nr:hypothetical protein HORIV_28640 [Halomonas olivaria]
MAEVVWTEPALQELDAIAEYIALDNPAAANHLVKRFSIKPTVWKVFPNPGGLPQNSLIRYTGR